MIEPSRGQRLRLAAGSAAIAVIVVVANLAIGPATAQSSGPSPSPSPPPAPSHAPGPLPTAGGAEGQAFSNLLDLFDAWQDARAKLRYAGICGSASDVADAYSAVEATKAALDAAMEQYIRDFSDQMYVGPVNKMKPSDQQRFGDDWDDLMDDLYRADKKQHPVGDCPKTPAANGPPPEKKPHPAPPPETPLPIPQVPDCFKADSDRRDMVTGLQKQRVAVVGDSSAVAAIDATIIRAGATAACSAGPHGSAVTIGIGIGLGGHDDHHHRDEHHDDHPRD